MQTESGFSQSNWFVWLFSVVPRASCTDCELEETTSSKDLLDLFCKSDFGEKLYFVLICNDHTLLMLKLPAHVFLSLSLSASG